MARNLPLGLSAFKIFGLRLSPPLGRIVHDRKEGLAGDAQVLQLAYQIHHPVVLFVRHDLSAVLEFAPELMLFSKMALDMRGRTRGFGVQDAIAVNARHEVATATRVGATLVGGANLEWNSGNRKLHGHARPGVVVGALGLPPWETLAHGVSDE